MDSGFNKAIDLMNSGFNYIHVPAKCISSNEVVDLRYAFRKKSWDSGGG